MRRDFGVYLFELMKENPDIWVITADLGYGLFDKIRDTYTDRFINTGAAEQAACDIAVGLALSGKIPIFYSITPFLIYRCFESWRTYINHEELPVIMIGSGRNDDYKHDGFSHYAGDDALILKALKKIHAIWPEDNAEMRLHLKLATENPRPTYINLVR